MATKKSSKKQGNTKAPQKSALVREQISELNILSEALTDYGERLIGEFWEAGNADLGRFPILVAGRLGALADEMAVSLETAEFDAAKGGAA